MKPICLRVVSARYGYDYAIEGKDGDKGPFQLVIRASDPRELRAQISNTDQQYVTEISMYYVQFNLCFIL